MTATAIGALTPDTVAKIHEALRASLPAELGETLRNELDELARLRKNEERRLEELESSQSIRRELNGQVTKLEEQLKAHKALDEREKAVAAREKECDLMKLRVEMHSEARSEMKDLVKTIFRSPIVQSSFSAMVPVPVEGAPPNPTYNTPGTPGMVMQSHASGTTTTQNT